MEIHRFPKEVIRSILRSLDFKALVHLFITNDTTIQKLISIPGAIDSIVLLSSHHVPRWASNYTLRSIRNLRRLAFGKAVRWNLETFQFLPSLNPLELELSLDITAKDVPKLMEKMYLNPHDETLRRKGRFLTAALLPDFRKFTPRLQHLSLPSTTASSSPTDIFAQSMWKNQHFYATGPAAYFRFPPMLTDLTYSDVLPNELEYLVKALPSCLESLKLSMKFETVVNVGPMLERFRSLQHLTVENTSALTWNSGVTTFPRTLKHLDIACTSPSFIQFLQECMFPLTGATVFNLRFENRTPSDSDEPLMIDLAAMLPMTVTDAQIGSYAHYTPGPGSSPLSSFFTLPSMLTSLCVTLSFRDEFLIAAISSLASLHTLRVSGADSSIVLNILGPDDRLEKIPLDVERGESGVVEWKQIIVPADALPASLTMLYVSNCRRSMTKSAIRCLPRGLVRLTVPFFDLSRHPALQKRAPLCELIISRPIFFDQTANSLRISQGNFEEFWSPSLDLHRWAHAVTRYYTDLNVHFTMQFDLPPYAKLLKAPGTTEVVVTSLEPCVGTAVLPIAKLLTWSFFTKSLINLTKLTLDLPTLSPESLTINLDDIPQNITHLELRNTPLKIRSSQGLLPPNLAYISTIAECRNFASSTSLPRRPKPLKYLDTPNWSFRASDVFTWDLKDFDRFAIDIVDFKDSKVAPFLMSRNINQRTRSNMSITITYIVTGVLASADNDSDWTDVTWKALRRAARKTLKHQLSLPLPITPSSRTATPSNGTPLPVGSVVTSLTEQKVLEEEQYLHLPLAAVRVNLNLPHLWKLAPFKDSGLSPRGDRSPGGGVPHTPTRWFGTSLVHLTLSGVTGVSEWRSHLPPSLEFLRIAIMGSIFDFGDGPLPKVKVFVLQAIEASPRLTNLPFRTKDLPMTLEHLIIEASHFTVHHKEKLGNTTTLKLPALKSVHLSGPTPTTVGTFLNRLPMKTLERLELKHCEDVEDERIRERQKVYHLDALLKGVPQYAPMQLSIDELCDTFGDSSS